ncbi:MAG: hypothetical protein ACT4OE_09140 [Sphingosinicella sp.]
MARKPEYPDEARVASKQDREKPGKSAKDPARPDVDGHRARHLVTGAAIGIGSAALVAALLYATRNRKDESGSKG